MPEFCSCGAKLPEDARFCHKCGKPVRDEPLLREEEAAPSPPPVPAAPPEPPPISLGNPFAVRAALPAAIAAFFSSLVLGPLAIITWVASGFFAVYLYRARTGTKLNLLSGAHLGWISGVLAFVFTLIQFTITVVWVTPTKMLSGARELLMQQAKSVPGGEAQVAQVVSLLATPAGLLLMLCTAFFLITLLPAFGGALGAKLLRRN